MGPLHPRVDLSPISPWPLGFGICRYLLSSREGSTPYKSATRTISVVRLSHTIFVCLLERETAVDDESLAADIGRKGAREEDCGAGHVTWCAHATDRYGPQSTFEAFGVFGSNFG